MCVGIYCLLLAVGAVMASCCSSVLNMSTFSPFHTDTNTIYPYGVLSLPPS